MASANASSEEAHLNHIQRRCLAVLRGGGRAGDELKAAATTMLKTGEASKRARASAGVVGTNSASAAARPGGADLQPSIATSLAHEDAAVAPSAGTGSWACAACTLQNASRAARCTACGEARPKSAKQPAIRMAALPTDLDDADADAFAAPKSKARAVPATAARAAPTTTAGPAAAAAATPTVAAPSGDDAHDSDEWE